MQPCIFVTADKLRADLNALNAVGGGRFVKTPTAFALHTAEREERQCAAALAAVLAGGVALRHIDEDGASYIYRDADEPDTSLAEDCLRVAGFPCDLEAMEQWVAETADGDFGCRDGDGNALWDEDALNESLMGLVAKAQNYLRDCGFNDPEVHAWEPGLTVVSVVKS